MSALSQEFRFRDVFNLRVIESLGRSIRREHAAFDLDAFVAAASRDLDALGMNERVAQIADALTEHLPDDFAEGARILVAALGDEQPEPGKTDWDGFIIMPQCAWIVTHGLAHFEEGMTALYHMTRRFSAEGYVRAYFDVDLARSMAWLRRWAEDPDPHVRRLVSEGTRPRLPMTPRIQRFVEDPAPVLELLELLRADPSAYVRRSVANNLNDIAKDNPEAALDVLERWGDEEDEGTQWIVRHASRTLLKQAHPRALALHGYTLDPSLEVSVALVAPEVAIGGELEFTATITSTAAQEQHLLIDYVIDYMKASGQTRPRVLKWTKRALAPGASLVLTRRQHMRQTSTRKLYPGEHALALQINGAVFASTPFTLCEEA